jgi:hypothetical protein
MVAPTRPQQRKCRRKQSVGGGCITPAASFPSFPSVKNHLMRTKGATTHKPSPTGWVTKPPQKIPSRPMHGASENLSENQFFPDNF